MKKLAYVTLELLAIAFVLVTGACGKSITAPTVSRTQIIGPCYVNALLTLRDGSKAYASVFYAVCPPLALVDSLGETETTTIP